MRTIKPEIEVNFSRVSKTATVIYLSDSKIWLKNVYSQRVINLRDFPIYLFVLLDSDRF